jgi:hypothetical protein
VKQAFNMSNRKTKRTSKKKEQEYVSLFAEILIDLSEAEEWPRIVECLNNTKTHKEAMLESLLSQAFDIDPF